MYRNTHYSLLLRIFYESFLSMQAYIYTRPYYRKSHSGNWPRASDLQNDELPIKKSVFPLQIYFCLFEKIFYRITGQIFNYFKNYEVFTFFTKILLFSCFSSCMILIYILRGSPPILAKPRECSHSNESLSIESKEFITLVLTQIL